jgi:hypothetical protein
MIAKGYERDFAEKTFKQLEGFGSYGFPESHAARKRGAVRSEFNLLSPSVAYIDNVYR